MPYCLQCGHLAETKIPPMDSLPRIVCPSCGYIHYENPKVINGCLLIHEDKVLLCRRAIEPRLLDVARRLYGAWRDHEGWR